MRFAIGTLLLALTLTSCSQKANNGQSFQAQGYAVPGKSGGTPNLVPLIPQAYTSCTGNNLGLYTWGHEVWNNQQSPLIDFFLKPKAREFSCGDVYVNVADYTAPDILKNHHNVVPFMKNVRATGNRATIFLVYGDVNVGANGAPNGPTDFADVFFNWFNSLSQSDIDAIVPIGLSYDCEHLAHTTISNALTRAQSLKSQILNSKLGGNASNLVIEWTIEGERKPMDTDIVMKLADRALMMSYRNHMGSSVRNPGGQDNMVTRLFNFMFKEQCERCLDDAYARVNYKAKIKLMFEADCQCGASCHKISFCAYDAREAGWGLEHGTGANYLVATLRRFDSELRSGTHMSSDQYNRLFGNNEGLGLYIIHNWQWFTCSFDDPSLAVTTPIGKQRETCANYHNYAYMCKNSE